MAVTKRKSTSVSKREDDRVVRTRRSVDAAFVALLQRRAYDAIRVSDVARKSGVGRATFYAHYASKDDLLRSQMDRLVAPLLPAAPGEPCLVDATALFAHTRSSASLFRSLVAGRGRRVVEASVEAHVDRARRVRGAAAEEDAAPSVVARFLAASLLGLVTWWLDHGVAMSPEEMQRTFAALCAGKRA